MGFKRPFDDEEFQDIPFKQARQVDYSNKLTQFSETGAHSNVPLKPYIADGYGSSFVKRQRHETFEDDKDIEFSNLAKDSGSSAPLSLVTSSSSDEDFGSRMAACSSLSPEYFQFEFPWKTPIPLDNVYSSYLDDFPRKQVPLGPNHQASIPLWDRHTKKDKLVESFNPNGSSLSKSDHHFYNDNEEKLMGTCIIPMPDTKLCLCSRNEAGCGRSDCSCLDEGSVRCVRQHIMEVREELIKSIGHEQCVNLGFYDMGEEVACKWTEEEERVFHEVVYTRPLSLGQKFWKYLAQVFPDRTREEIVSYYFNVFVLRKRAAQNRSKLLDIDSDDDELPQIHRGSYIQDEEGEDSDLESPVDHYDHADLGEDILEDDDSDNDDGGDDFDGDLGDVSGDTTGEGSGIDHASEAIDMNSIDPVVEHMDKNAGSEKVDFTVHDDSCMSFEFQADKGDPGAPFDTRPALHVNRGTSDHSKCLPSEVDGCDDDVDRVYLLEPCDTKVWGARYLSPIRGVDLLPTSNIIEEIFGQGTCEDQTRDVNSIS